jgi:hypothetical protein
LPARWRVLGFRAGGEIQAVVGLLKKKNNKMLLRCSVLELEGKSR